MSLENMRSLGVREVEISCACGRQTILDVSELEGAIEVPSLRRRFKCSGCGARPIDVRPNWREYQAHGMPRRI